MRAYGVIELTVSSPAQSFCEPLSLDEVRTFLNVAETSPPDTSQNNMLEGFVIAAREIAEIAQGRELTEKQYDLHLDLLVDAGALSTFGFNQDRLLWNFGRGNEIELRTPLQSVDLITYKNSDGNTVTLTEGTDYIVDLSRGFILPPYGKTWPFFTAWPSSSILIRFTAGYPETHPFWSNSGQRILVGMKMLIASWFEQRLPFDAVRAIVEYPYSVTPLFNFGSVPRVR